MAKYDVIIIGSGFGGLGAGITLQHNNPKIKTLILEQHTVPGGFVTGFTRKGYYFDGGAEGIMGMGEKEPLRAALREMGFEHEFFRLNPLEVNYFDNGKTLSLYSTKDELINEIKDKFPEDEIKFKQFLDEC
nr:FAD-binding protein [Asgard group archaeon]